MFRSIVWRGLWCQCVVAGELSLARSRLVSYPLHGCPLARASLHRQPFRLGCGSAVMLPLSRAAVGKLRTGGALDVLRAARTSLSPQNVNACRRVDVERRVGFVGSRSMFVHLLRVSWQRVVAGELSLARCRSAIARVRRRGPLPHTR